MIVLPPPRTSSAALSVSRGVFVGTITMRDGGAGEFPRGSAEERLADGGPETQRDTPDGAAVIRRAVVGSIFSPEEAFFVTGGGGEDAASPDMAVCT